MDSQAVNNTKMWLYIKILEDESSIIHQTKKEKTKQYAKQQKTTFTLPNLKHNIINGNTLIEKDFSLNEKENKEIKAFDWHSIPALRSIIKDRGGFDVVITNPPYISNRNMNKHIKTQLQYMKKKYKVISKGQVDLYYGFFEKGYSVLKKDGYMAYITSNTFLHNNSAVNLRKYLNRPGA